jgi:pimeloyl-ACP methyl ester carboxylesterase
LDLHYEVHGSGKPVVLVHSGGADMRDWSYLVPLLSENFHVITFDGRGAGRSPSPIQPPSYVEDLLSLLDHLEISQAAIVVHSMGGRIATEFAIHYPKSACSKRSVFSTEKVV